MSTVAMMLQTLVTEVADLAAAEVGVIQRIRKFTAQTLARTFLFGFIQNPDASDEELAQVAAQCNVEVTTQAITERFTQRLVDFLELIARHAMTCAVESNQALAPLLERFPEVRIIDSSTVTLPDSQAEKFSGCGGSHGSGKAAIKLQTELDLRTGRLFVQCETGRSPDNASSRQQAPLPRGSLRITDLGYFDTEVFENYSEQGVYWLSRLQFGTHVFHPNGDSLELMKWLNQQTKSVIDIPILMSACRHVPCRMVAWRVPEEVANRRRQKLREESVRKRGCQPTEARLAWCDWMILVTNAPAELLSPSEMGVLYRSRWQIELLFKRWKSQGLLARMDGSTDTRKMVRFWARMIAVLVQHWLLVASVWGDPRHSLSKAHKAIRQFVSLLIGSLDNLQLLTATLATIRRTLSSTARQNKRTKPSTFELLSNPNLLTWGLT